MSDDLSAFGSLIWTNLGSRISTYIMRGGGHSRLNLTTSGQATIKWMNAILSTSQSTLSGLYIERVEIHEHCIRYNGTVNRLNLESPSLMLGGLQTWSGSSSCMVISLPSSTAGMDRRWSPRLPKVRTRHAAPPAPLFCHLVSLYSGPMLKSILSSRIQSLFLAFSLCTHQPSDTPLSSARTGKFLHFSRM